jgi:cellulose biosynthesis protein BcsQ
VEQYENIRGTMFDLRRIKRKFAAGMAKIFFVSNGSNQSGKSTTAFNLALCFATLGNETLLIDNGKSSWIKELLKPEDALLLNTISPFFSYTTSTDIYLQNFDMVVVDTSQVNLPLSFLALEGDKRLLIPVEAEYFGMNELTFFLENSKDLGLEIGGIIPVMLRESSSSSELLMKGLRANFGNLVFEPGIQRNLYLARQKDFGRFLPSELTEKAGVTYLNLANSLVGN